MSDAKYYAYLAYRMMEGDDILEQLFSALSRDGFIDPDSQEWIYDEDENDEEE